MPVIRVGIERLVRLTGLRGEELEDVLFRLKCETETVEGEIAIEVNPDRPDMFIGEGIARAVKGLLGIEKGWKPPKAEDSGITIRAGRVPSRPFIAGLVVYDAGVDEEFLIELIQFQEKLHEGMGRNRRKIAIGLHDLDKLPSTSITYEASGLETVFKPLGYGEEMSGREILERTEQGLKYGRISLEGNTHPFLYSGGEVIAMPPVINSDITRVEPGTRSLFIDVTGTDLGLVLQVTDLLASTLSERRGAWIGKVAISGVPGVAETPLLKTRKMRLSTRYVSRLIGSELDAEQCIDLLGRARFNAGLAGGDSLIVEVPPFRVDIIGEADLVEDIAMMIGYDRLEPSKERPIMRGELLAETLVSRRLRKLLVGLGFTETMQLILSNPRVADSLGFRNYIEVSNPVQAEYSIVRPSIIVSLLSTLIKGQHSTKPVKIFEIGKVAYLDEGRVKEDLRLGVAYLDDEVSYEDIQAPIYAILRLLGVRYSVEEWSRPPLLSGRASMIVSGEAIIGWMGEVDPGALEALGIEYPVAVAEISVPRLSSSPKT